MCGNQDCQPAGILPESVTRCCAPSCSSQRASPLKVSANFNTLLISWITLNQRAEGRICSIPDTLLNAPQTARPLGDAVSRVNSPNLSCHLRWPEAPSKADVSEMFFILLYMRAYDRIQFSTARRGTRRNSRMLPVRNVAMRRTRDSGVFKYSASSRTLAAFLTHARIRLR